jgi:type II secretory pathway component PulL
MLKTKSNLRRRWYDYNWDWALISLLALVLLAGIVLWTYADHAQTAAIPDAAAGQSTRPSLPIFPN